MANKTAFVHPILKHIPHNQQWGGSNRTIKKLLKAQGFSDEEIQQLKDEERILIGSFSMARKLHSREQLYIIPLKEPTEKEPKYNRFDLEE